MDRTVIVPAPHGIFFNIKDHGFCYLCNISITSWEVKQQHLKGSKHGRKLVQFFNDAGIGTQEIYSPENFRACRVCEVVVLENVEDHLVSEFHRSRGSVGENANMHVAGNAAAAMMVEPSLTMPRAPAENDESLTFPKMAEVKPSMTTPQKAAAAEVDTSLTLPKTKPCAPVSPMPHSEFPVNSSAQVRNPSPSSVSLEDNSSSVFISTPAAACDEARSPSPSHEIENLKLVSLEDNSSSCDDRPTLCDPSSNTQPKMMKNAEAKNVLDKDSILYNGGVTKLNIPLPEAPEPQCSPENAAVYLEDQYCQLCFTKFTGRESAKQHYDSDGHKTKKEIAKLVYSGTLPKDPVTGALMNKFDDIDWYVCCVCMRRLNSSKAYSEHLQTKKHITNELEKNSGYPIEKGK